MNGKSKSQSARVWKVKWKKFSALPSQPLLLFSPPWPRYSFKTRSRSFPRERKESTLLIYSTKELQENYVDLNVVQSIALFFLIDWSKSSLWWNILSFERFYRCIFSSISRSSRCQELAREWETGQRWVILDYRRIKRAAKYLFLNES